MSDSNKKTLFVCEHTFWIKDWCENAAGFLWRLVSALQKNRRIFMDLCMRVIMRGEGNSISYSVSVLPSAVWTQKHRKTLHGARCCKEGIYTHFFLARSIKYLGSVSCSNYPDVVLLLNQRDYTFRTAWLFTGFYRLTIHSQLNKHSDCMLKRHLAN